MTVMDKDDDIDLTAVAGRAYIICRNGGFGLSLGAPDKVVRINSTTNKIWISNGQPGERILGTCELQVYVQDKAGNKSETVKAVVDFK